MKKTTLVPIAAAPVASEEREFGRTKHVEQIFGIKRGTLYNLFADGKIKGKVLRVRGHLTGVRLWDIPSIREFIRSQADDDGDLGGACAA